MHCRYVFTNSWYLLYFFLLYLRQSQSDISGTEKCLPYVHRIHELTQTTLHSLEVQKLVTGLNFCLKIFPIFLFRCFYMNNLFIYLHYTWKCSRVVILRGCSLWWCSDGSFATALTTLNPELWSLLSYGTTNCCHNNYCCWCCRNLSEDTYQILAKSTMVWWLWNIIAQWGGVSW